MRGKKLTQAELKAKLAVDSTKRREIFKDLLNHIRSGLSLDCFPALSDKSIKTFLTKYPEEFLEEELHQAMREGKDYWETLGKRQSEGTCLGNSRSWYYNMSNRYGWRDKHDVQADHKGSVNVNVISYASKKPSHITDEASTS